jgi:hypothetical protein
VKLTWTTVVCALISGLAIGSIVVSRHWQGEFVGVVWASESARPDKYLPGRYRVPISGVCYSGAIQTEPRCSCSNSLSPKDSDLWYCEASLTGPFTLQIDEDACRDHPELSEYCPVALAWSTLAATTQKLHELNGVFAGEHGETAKRLVADSDSWPVGCPWSWPLGVETLLAAAKCADSPPSE